MPATLPPDIEVIDLTGDDIDKILPEIEAIDLTGGDIAEAPGVVNAAADVLLLDTMQISEVGQWLFSLPSTLARGARDWLQGLVLDPSRELSPAVEGVGSVASVAVPTTREAQSPASNILGAPPARPSLATFVSRHRHAVAVTRAKQPAFVINEKDWEEDDEQDDVDSFIPLPNAKECGWTAINARPVNGRRTRGYTRRKGRPLFKVAASPRRSRSPSVEFLHERTLREASPPPRRKRKASQTDLRGRRNLKVHGAVGPWANIHQTAALASRRLAGAEGTEEGYTQLTMYTDGSISRNRFGGAGVAYYTGKRWVGKASALGKAAPNSNDAEMSAIFLALQLARKVRQPNQLQILVVTDSADCLESLNPEARAHSRRVISEPLARAVRAQKEQFATEGVHVAFQWVKGHSGLEGNELADQLAGFGSASAAEGLMTHYDIPDVYVQFPNLKYRPMVKDIASAMQHAARKRTEEVAAKHKIREIRSAAMRAQHQERLQALKARNAPEAQAATVTEQRETIWGQLLAGRRERDVIRESPAYNRGLPQSSETAQRLQFFLEGEERGW